MHIAFTQRHLDSGNGGEERSLTAIMNQFSLFDDMKLTLFYQKKGDFNATLDKNVSQRPYLTQELSLENGFIFFFQILRAVWFVKKHKITRIHVNHYKDITWAAFVSVLSGCKLSLHLRLNAPEYLSKQYRWGMGKCDFFVTNNGFMKQEWELYLSKPIYVIYNGLDINTQKIEIANEEIDLLFVGRLVEENSLHIAIESLKYLPSNRFLTVIGSYKDSYLLGQHDYSDNINLLIKENDLERRVHFMGGLANALPYLKKAVYTIVPSEWEPFGRVFMEAWTLGTPAIACKNRGLLEILEKYPALEEYTFELNNPQDLAKTILKEKKPLSLSFPLTETIQRMKDLFLKHQL